MIFLTYYPDPELMNDPASLRLGLKTDHGVIDIASAKAAYGFSVPDTPADFYAAGLDALPAFETLLSAEIDPAYIYPEDSLRLGAVVPTPGKILCIGLNYRKHAAESNMLEPKQPVLFSKFNNAIADPGEDVPMRADWTQVDYEAELGVVIGRKAVNVDEADALHYVLGYCNVNDLSERVLQFVSGQWLLGKSLDKFLPVGPYLVTAASAGDPQALPVRGWLNGELRQDSNTADMIFSVAQIIAYASRYMTLMPGDLISTGTPEGVIFGMSEKVWMKPGDSYTVEIGNLGRLTNRMVEARS